MKKVKDPKEKKHGAGSKPKRGTTRLWILIDKDIVEWFEARTAEAGRKRYDRLMNKAMRWHIESGVAAVADSKVRKRRKPATKK